MQQNLMVGWSVNRSDGSRTLPATLSHYGIGYRTLWFSSSSNNPNTTPGERSGEGEQIPENEKGRPDKATEGNSQSAEARSEQHEDDVRSMGETELRSEVTNLRNTLKEEMKKGEEMKEKLIRTLADMENLRERTSRQVAEARQFAVQGLVKSLVDVADNLERAAGSVVIGDVDGSNEIDLDRALSLLKSLRDGVVLTDNILMKVLESQGVQRYDPLGTPFDPNLHNALFEVPDATKEPGTVALVIKKGYMLHDRAVRAAEVGVVAATNDSPATDEPGRP